MTILHCAPTCANPEKKTGNERVKELRKQIDDSVDRLAKAIDDVRASDTFKQYLNVQARFHNYSWRNTWLIFMQRSDATRVAGFQTWKKIGRNVKKGEHGIMIFAPCPFKREVERESGDTEVESGMFFRPVYVFDLAQTEGAELPEVDVPTIDRSADELLSRLTSLAVSRGFPVAFQPISEGAFGVATKSGITIDNRHPTGQQAKTLCHEIAHTAMHLVADRPKELTRGVAELEAESVAYVVCTHFGLDVEVRASRYIALWDGDSRGLRESMERIADTARSIIDDIESLNVRKAVA